MPRLDFYTEYIRFVTFRLGDRPVLIGRGADCDIQLPAGTVSRHHTRIVPRGDGGHVIEDLSTNGTRVNAAMIEGSAPLALGDRIYIESYVLIYQADDTPPETLDADRTILGDKPTGLG